MKTPNIADRSEVFYWQTDRAVEPAEAGKIWADRHRYFTDAQLTKAISAALPADPLANLEPLDPSAQTGLGNVNSVRSGTLQSGRPVIIRCHPRGIPNGYFHVEAAAASLAKQFGLPSFNTLAVHDYAGGDDFAFAIIEKLPGTAISKWLEARPADEARLLPRIGQMMARLHQTRVDGFGPFDNQLASTGRLRGLHQSFARAVRAGLEFNLEVLRQENVLTGVQASAITRLFADNNPLLARRDAVLVHNDFADWNLLTDGSNVTGILDWDECVGGDPVADIACWSTFFEPERLARFLEGYWHVAPPIDDFAERFELLRLRYVVSKMTLRLRRYSWEPSEAMKVKIATGQVHLAQSVRYFGI